MSKKLGRGRLKLGRLSGLNKLERPYFRRPLPSLFYPLRRPALNNQSKNQTGHPIESGAECC